MLSKMIKKTPFDSISVEDVRNYFVRKSGEFKKGKNKKN